MIERVRNRAKWAEGETYAIFLAYKDPRVPLYAKLLVAAIIIYALSPIDLIPDFIPIIGYLDDLVLIPLGIALAIKVIPGDILDECRAEVQLALSNGQPIAKLGASIVIISWIVVISLCAVTIYLIS
ncbi:MAG: YkvA family protein [Chloroflexota bacterium]|nr:YkvA family protein [Chloroflexota bacterium]